MPKVAMFCLNNIHLYFLLIIIIFMPFIQQLLQQQQQQQQDKKISCTNGMMMFKSGCIHIFEYDLHGQMKLMCMCVLHMS